MSAPGSELIPTPSKRWDLFISHASEDKPLVVYPLVERLQRAGLRVWLDRQELRLGDSLREKIDEGLAESRFGVLIISPQFLLKHWPRQELNGLMGLEEEGRKVILPVWHEVSKEQLRSFSPILADRIAANTSDGLDQVVQQIVDVVMSPDSGSPSRERPSSARRLLDLLSCNSEPSAICDFLVSYARRNPFRHIATMVSLNGQCVPIIDTFEGNAGTYVTFTAVGALSGPLLCNDGALAADLEAIRSELVSSIVWCALNAEAAARAISKEPNCGALKSARFWSRDNLIYNVRVVSRRRHDLSASDKRFLVDYHSARTISVGHERSLRYEMTIETYDSLVEQMDLAERPQSHSPMQYRSRPL